MSNEIEELFAGFNPDDSPLMKMEGYDDCIIGVVERIGLPPLLCYDKDKVIERLKKDGMSYFEALEYFEYNQLGAHLGEYTPCFITFNRRGKYNNG